MKISKHLIIFCEGYEEIQKTKIARRLAIELKLPMLRLTSPRSYFRRGKGSLEEFSYIFYQTLYQLRHTNYIVDGGLFSSLVRCNVYKRKSKLSYIYPLIKAIKPLVIFFTTSKKANLLKVNSKHQKISLNERLILFKGYEMYFKKLQLVPVLWINIADSTTIQIVQKIIKYLEEEEYIRWN